MLQLVHTAGTLSIRPYEYNHFNPRLFVYSCGFQWGKCSDWSTYPGKGWSENRKLRIIKEVLKREDDAVLTQVEMLLENRSIGRIGIKNKPSDYGGCISPESARELLPN